MTREKTYFGIGLAVGIVLALLFLFYFAPRYSTMKSGNTLVKLDRWSGQTWRFTENQWKKIQGANRDWEKIDKMLMEALRVPSGGVDRENALGLLREKDPVLKDLTDDELLERIKLVYSREILVNLYMKNLLELEREAKAK